jgi:sugar phosphate isomerase/epimerase
MATMVKDVSLALHLMQASSTTVGMGFEIWLELLERTPKHSPTYKIVQDRLKETAKRAVFPLGNLLDPRLKGRSLGVDHRAAAFALVEKLGGNGLVEHLAMYMTGAGPYGIHLPTRTPDPGPL